MISIINILKRIFYQYSKTAFPEAELTLEMMEIAVSTQERFGHYQFNSAMKFTKILKAAPRQLAEKIIAQHGQISEADQLIEKLEIAGPGFINISLRTEFLAEKIDSLWQYPEQIISPIGEGQTISQPYIVAFMTQALALDPAARVLEVGTGSGYQTAVLAELVDTVQSIEIVPELATRSRERLTRLGYQNVQLREGDGYAGWPDAAPFDAIMVTAAPDHVPQPLIDQLALGGLMIIPVGDDRQMLTVLTRTADGVTRSEILPVLFVPMTGEAQR